MAPYEGFDVSEYRYTEFHYRTGKSPASNRIIVTDNDLYPPAAIVNSLLSRE